MKDIKERLAIIEQKLAELFSNIEKASPLTTKKRNNLKEQTFAFPKQRKMPINDASHTRAAMSRFGQVSGVSDAEKKTAYRKILSAAKKFGIDAEGFKARWGKKYG